MKWEVFKEAALECSEVCVEHRDRVVRVSGGKVDPSDGDVESVITEKIKLWQQRWSKLCKV